MESNFARNIVRFVVVGAWGMNQEPQLISTLHNNTAQHHYIIHKQPSPAKYSTLKLKTSL